MKDYSKEYQDLLKENPDSAPAEDKEFYSDMNKFLQKQDEFTVPQKITQEILGESKRFLKEDLAKPVRNAKKPRPILIPFLAVAATALIGINTYLFMSNSTSETQVATQITHPQAGHSQEKTHLAEVNFDQLLQNDDLDTDFLNIEEEFALLDIEMALNFTP